MGSAAVISVLGRLCRLRNKPRAISADGGPEFASVAQDIWALHKSVTQHSSRSGKPTDNAMIGAFNARARANCLNVHGSNRWNKPKKRSSSGEAIPMTIDPTTLWANWPKRVRFNRPC